MIEHPVPHDEHAGDHDIGHEPGAEKHAGEDNFILHDAPLARVATVSARVPAFVRMASSE